MQKAQYMIWSLLELNNKTLSDEEKDLLKH